MSKVWLVGENNPYSANQHHALYPWPSGCAGHRLCFSVLGMSEDEYLAAFERRNLLHADRWSTPAARKAANLLLGEVRDGDALVLLGAKVAQAFGHRYVPLAEHRGLVHGTVAYRAILVPHPSGLSRAWHDPEVAPRVRQAVRGLVRDCSGVSAAGTERWLGGLEGVTQLARPTERTRDDLHDPACAACRPPSEAE